MTDGRAERIGRSLEGATGFLAKVLDTEPSDIQRAAAIQAFEFTYELSRKLLQARLRHQGVQVTTPRAVFRAVAERVYRLIAGDFLTDARRLVCN